MFLHVLNDTQQKAFLGLAKQFIECDSSLSDEEQNLLELMLAETGLSFDEEIPPSDPETLASTFDTKQARSAVLLELIGVGHADNEFHADESPFIRDVASRLGVSHDDVMKMESWVERQLALAQEAEAFWAE